MISSKSYGSPQSKGPGRVKASDDATTEVDAIAMLGWRKANTRVKEWHSDTRLYMCRLSMGYGQWAMARERRSQRCSRERMRNAST